MRDEIIKGLANRVLSTTGCKVNDHAIALIIYEYTQTQLKQQWIPVSEPPPIDGEEYLFAFRYSDDEEYIIEVSQHFSGEDYISDCYWMPLPQPPTAEEE